MTVRLARAYVDARMEHDRVAQRHSTEPLQELPEWSAEIIQAELLQSSVKILAQFPDGSSVEIVRILEDDRNGPFNCFRVIN